MVGLSSGSKSHLGAAGVSEATASSIIADIRKKLLVGVELGNSEVQEGVLNLQEALQRSIGKLADDIYKSQAHFLLELIQNADDNQYAAHVTPKVAFHVGASWLLVDNNEHGFEPKNVRALCDVAKSTKTFKTGYIGEKGVGFKSVFKYTHEPHIFSREFSFKFLSDQISDGNALGFIVPHWVEKDLALPKEAALSERMATTLYLPMKSMREHEHLKGEIGNALGSHLLLFLRQLRIIDVELDGQTKRFSRQDEGSVVVLVEEVLPGLAERERSSAALAQHPRKEQRFNLCRATFRPPSRELDPRRAQEDETEIVMAFGVRADGKVQPERGHLFAFLPVGRYGFGFTVQADFLLTTSREEIVIENAWNRFLFEKLPDVFIAAVKTIFKASEGDLAANYLSYLRESTMLEPALEQIFHQIKERLKSLKSVLTEGGAWRKPKDVVQPSALCCQVVSAERLKSATGFEYINHKTSLDNRDFLSQLGCRIFDLQMLRHCLQSLDLDQEDEPDSWYINLFNYLKNTHRSEIDELKQLVSDLRIFPVAGGLPHMSLIAESDANYTPLLLPGSSDVETQRLVAMGLAVLRVKVDKPLRKFLSQELGLIVPVPEKVIQTSILPSYKDARCYALPATQLRAQLEYVKDHNDLVMRRPDIQKECRECLICEASVGNDLRTVVRHKINACHIPSRDMDSVLNSGSRQPIYVISRDYFADPDGEDGYPKRNASSDFTGASAMAWQRFFQGCGATRGLQTTTNERKYRYNQESPFCLDNHPIPKTWDHYLVSWPVFVPEAKSLVSDKSRSLEGQMALVKLLDSVWDEEYAPKMKLKVTTNHMDNRRPCYWHQQTRCTEVECQRETKVELVDEEELAKLYLVQALRGISVRCQDGCEMRLEETFCPEEDVRNFWGDALPFIDLELTSEEFMRVAGVTRTVTVSSFLKYLKILAKRQQPREADVASVLKAYIELSRVVERNDAEKHQIRQAFDSQKLILMCDKNEEDWTYRWLDLVRARWKGDRLVFGSDYVFLSEDHHLWQHEKFIVKTLGVPKDMPAKDYVDKLRSFTQQRYPKDHIVAVHRVYQELSRRLERWKGEGVDELKEAIDVFRREELLLTRDHGWVGIRDAGLVVADDFELRNHIVKSRLAHRIKMLNFEGYREQEWLNKCKPLFRELELKNLSQVAKSRIYSTQNKVELPDFSGRCQKLAKKIGRLAKFWNIFDKVTEAAWRQLANMSVWELDDLSVVYTILGVSLPPLQRIAVGSVEHGDLFLDRAYHRQANPAKHKLLATEFCRLLSVSIHSEDAFFQQIKLLLSYSSEEDQEALLRGDGVPDLDEHESWFEEGSADAVRTQEQIDPAGREAEPSAEAAPAWAVPPSAPRSSMPAAAAPPTVASEAPAPNTTATPTQWPSDPWEPRAGQSGRGWGSWSADRFADADADTEGAQPHRWGSPAGPGYENDSRRWWWQDSTWGQSRTEETAGRDAEASASVDEVARRGQETETVRRACSRDELKVDMPIWGCFYGAWYPAIVFDFVDNGLIEVKWDGEESISWLRLEDISLEKPLPEAASPRPIPPRAASMEARSGQSPNAPPPDQDDDESPSQEARAINAWASAPQTGVPPVARSHNQIVKDLSVTKQMLDRIFEENGGTEILGHGHPRALTEERRTVAVTGLRYMQRTMSDVFGSGQHRGQPVVELVKALEAGTIRPKDFTLRGATFDGKIYSFNHRRLWALKEFAKNAQEDVQVDIVVFQLCPVTAAFMQRHAPLDEGLSIEVLASGSRAAP